LIFGVALIYLVISLLVSIVPFNLGTIVVVGPLALGFAYFSLNISRGNPVEINNIFEGFKNFLIALVA